MFQDEPVKAILTGSHIAPQAESPLVTQAYAEATDLRTFTEAPLHPASLLSTPLRLISGSAPQSIILLYRFLLNGFRSFNNLSKVLFIFPSQYLFAIGFPHIFSLRRSLSPAWGCNIKQPDSLMVRSLGRGATYGAITLFGQHFQTVLRPVLLSSTSPDYNSPHAAR